jgi:hypothetical protein
MRFTAGLKTMVAVASLVTVTVAGCSSSNTEAGRPTTATPPTTTSNEVNQPELQKDFVAEQNPIGALQAGLYALLRAPIGDAVEITGYRQKIAADGATAKTTVFAFDLKTSSWQPQTDQQLVWSASQAKWVDSDLTQVLSAGPNGSRGWPTVKGVNDAGTSLDTFSYRELAGLSLRDGLQEGFAPGHALPQSLQDVTFSPGARAYLVTTTTVDPTFAIRRVSDPRTRADTMPLVYACGKPSADCTKPASSIATVNQDGGQFTNPSGASMLTLDGHGQAVLRPVKSDIPLATFTYRMVDTGGPTRITFQAANSGDAKTFGRATGISVDNFAFFEYDGQVAVGISQPANRSVSLFAGYDHIAANDLLTHWTPVMPAVSP